MSRKYRSERKERTRDRVKESRPRFSERHESSRWGDRNRLRPRATGASYSPHGSSKYSKASLTGGQFNREYCNVDKSTRYLPPVPLDEGRTHLSRESYSQASGSVNSRRQQVDDRYAPVTIGIGSTPVSRVDSTFNSGDSQWMNDYHSLDHPFSQNYPERTSIPEFHRPTLQPSNEEQEVTSYAYRGLQYSESSLNRLPLRNATVERPLSPINHRGIVPHSDKDRLPIGHSSKIYEHRETHSFPSGTVDKHPWPHKSYLADTGTSSGSDTVYEQSDNSRYPIKEDLAHIQSVHHRRDDLTSQFEYSATSICDLRSSVPTDGQYKATYPETYSSNQHVLSRLGPQVKKLVEDTILYEAKHGKPHPLRLTSSTNFNHVSNSPRLFDSDSMQDTLFNSDVMSRLGPESSTDVPSQFTGVVTDTQQPLNCDVMSRLGPESSAGVPSQFSGVVPDTQPLQDLRLSLDIAREIARGSAHQQSDHSHSLTVNPMRGTLEANPKELSLSNADSFVELNGSGSDRGHLPDLMSLRGTLESNPKELSTSVANNFLEFNSSSSERGRLTSIPDLMSLHGTLEVNPKEVSSSHADNFLDSSSERGHFPNLMSLHFSPAKTLDRAHHGESQPLKSFSSYLDSSTHCDLRHSTMTTLQSQASESVISQTYEQDVLPQLAEDNVPNLVPSSSKKHVHHSSQDNVVHNRTEFKVDKPDSRPIPLLPFSGFDEISSIQNSDQSTNVSSLVPCSSTLGRESATLAVNANSRETDIGKVGLLSEECPESSMTTVPEYIEGNVNSTVSLSDVPIQVSTKRDHSNSRSVPVSAQGDRSLKCTKPAKFPSSPPMIQLKKIESLARIVVGEDLTNHLNQHLLKCLYDACATVVNHLQQKKSNDSQVIQVLSKHFDGFYSATLNSEIIPANAKILYTRELSHLRSSCGNNITKWKGCVRRFASLSSTIPDDSGSSNEGECAEKLSTTANEKNITNNNNLEEQLSSSARGTVIPCVSSAVSTANEVHDETKLFSSEHIPCSLSVGYQPDNTSPKKALPSRSLLNASSDSSTRVSAGHASNPSPDTKSTHLVHPVPLTSTIPVRSPERTAEGLQSLLDMVSFSTTGCTSPQLTIERVEDSAIGPDAAQPPCKTSSLPNTMELHVHKLASTQSPKKSTDIRSHEKQGKSGKHGEISNPQSKANLDPVKSSIHVDNSATCPSADVHAALSNLDSKSKMIKEPNSQAYSVDGPSDHERTETQIDNCKSPKRYSNEPICGVDSSQLEADLNLKPVDTSPTTPCVAGNHQVQESKLKRTDAEGVGHLSFRSHSLSPGEIVSPASSPDHIQRKSLSPGEIVSPPPPSPNRIPSKTDLKSDDRSSNHDNRRKSHSHSSDSPRDSASYRHYSRNSHRDRSNSRERNYTRSYRPRTRNRYERRSRTPPRPYSTSKSYFRSENGRFKKRQRSKSPKSKSSSGGVKTHESRRRKDHKLGSESGDELELLELKKSALMSMIRDKPTGATTIEPAKRTDDCTKSSVDKSSSKNEQNEEHHVGLEDDFNVVDMEVCDTDIEPNLKPIPKTATDLCLEGNIVNHQSPSKQSTKDLAPASSPVQETKEKVESDVQDSSSPTCKPQASPERTNAAEKSETPRSSHLVKRNSRAPTPSFSVKVLPGNEKTWNIEPVHIDPGSGTEAEDSIDEERDNECSRQPKTCPALKQTSEIIQFLIEARKASEKSTSKLKQNVPSLPRTAPSLLPTPRKKEYLELKIKLALHEKQKHLKKKALSKGQSTSCKGKLQPRSKTAKLPSPSQHKRKVSSSGKKKEETDTFQSSPRKDQGRSPQQHVGKEQKASIAHFERTLSKYQEELLQHRIQHKQDQSELNSLTHQLTDCEINIEETDLKVQALETQVKNLQKQIEGARIVQRDSAKLKLELQSKIRSVKVTFAITDAKVQKTKDSISQTKVALEDLVGKGSQLDVPSKQANVFLPQYETISDSESGSGVSNVDDRHDPTLMPLAVSSLTLPKIVVEPVSDVEGDTNHPSTELLVEPISDSETNMVTPCPSEAVPGGSETIQSIPSPLAMVVSSVTDSMKDNADTNHGSSNHAVKVASVATEGDTLNAQDLLLSVDDALKTEARSVEIKSSSLSKVGTVATRIQREHSYCLNQFSIGSNSIEESLTPTVEKVHQQECNTSCLSDSEQKQINEVCISKQLLVTTAAQEKKASPSLTKPAIATTLDSDSLDSAPVNVEDMTEEPTSLSTSMSSMCSSNPQSLNINKLTVTPSNAVLKVPVQTRSQTLTLSKGLDSSLSQISFSGNSVDRSVVKGGNINVPSCISTKHPRHTRQHPFVDENRPPIPSTFQHHQSLELRDELYIPKDQIFHPGTSELFTLSIDEPPKYVVPMDQVFSLEVEPGCIKESILDNIRRRSELSYFIRTGRGSVGPCNEMVNSQSSKGDSEFSTPHPTVLNNASLEKKEVVDSQPLKVEDDSGTTVAKNASLEMPLSVGDKGKQSSGGRSRKQKKPLKLTPALKMKLMRKDATPNVSTSLKQEDLDIGAQLKQHMEKLEMLKDQLDNKVCDTTSETQASTKQNTALVLKRKRPVSFENKTTSQPKRSRKHSSIKDHNVNIQKTTVKPDVVATKHSGECSKKEKNDRAVLLLQTAFKQVLPKQTPLSVEQVLQLLSHTQLSSTVQTTMTDRGTARLWLSSPQKLTKMSFSVNSLLAMPSKNAVHPVKPSMYVDYSSPLLSFSSYSLNPAYRNHEKLQVGSLTYSNKLEPKLILCKFEALGTCRDPKCTAQHLRDIQLSKEEVVTNLVSNAPQLAKCSPSELSDADTAQPLAKKTVADKLSAYASSVVKRYSPKLSNEEIYKLTAHEVNKAREKNKAVSKSSRYVSFEDRSLLTTNSQQKKPSRLPTVSPRAVDVSIPESGLYGLDWDGVETTAYSHKDTGKSERRYFMPKGVIAKEVDSKSEEHDVGYWVDLAKAAVKQKKYGDSVKIIEKGLKDHPTSEELWVHLVRLRSYLIKTKLTSSSEQSLDDLCTKAMKKTKSYAVILECISLGMCYSLKRKWISEGLKVLLISCPTSHQCLEMLLNSVVLDTSVGRLGAASGTMEIALFGETTKPSCDGFKDLAKHLSLEDKCVACLCIIHLVYWRQVPVCVFNRTMSRTVSFPSLIVDKLFSIEWDHSKQLTHSECKQIRGLFVKSLQICELTNEATSEAVKTCMPLLRSMVAFEVAHGDVQKAVVDIEKLVDVVPDVVELWLLCLRTQVLIGGSVNDVIFKATTACPRNAEVYLFAAQSELSTQSNSDVTKAMGKAVEWLGSCVKTFYKCESFTGKVESLVLYRKLLGQLLPYDTQLPHFSDDVNPKQLGKQLAPLWMCYSLLVELTTPSSTNSEFYHHTAGDAYESAVHSVHNTDDSTSIWREYLYHLRSNAIRTPGNTENHRALLNCTRRCLLAVDHTRNNPHTVCGQPSQYDDYTFHNEAIHLFLGCLQCTPLVKLSLLQSFGSLMPNNPLLVEMTVSCAMEQEIPNIELAQSMLAAYLAKYPSSGQLWKLAISIELQVDHTKEARWMYQQALEALPHDSSLWIDFLVFELKEGIKMPHVDPSSSLVTTVLKRAQECGVDLHRVYPTTS